MDTQTVPDSTSPDVWLEWMAGHPCFTQAIDAAVEAGMHFQLLAYLVGLWEATHRADQLAERIVAVSRHAEELMSR